MRGVFKQEAWPEFWKCAYGFDLDELFGAVSHYGQADVYKKRCVKSLGLRSEILPRVGRILDFAAAPEESETLAICAGFRLDKSLLLTNQLTCGWMKSEKLLRILPYKTVQRFERLAQNLPLGSMGGYWLTQ